MPNSALIQQENWFSSLSSSSNEKLFLDHLHLLSYDSLKDLLSDTFVMFKFVWRLIIWLIFSGLIVFFMNLVTSISGSSFFFLFHFYLWAAWSVMQSWHPLYSFLLCGYELFSIQLHGYLFILVVALSVYFWWIV